MSDMREAVVSAIVEQHCDTDLWGIYNGDLKDGDHDAQFGFNPWKVKLIEMWGPMADAAIAAATPYIEAALIERLAQKADDKAKDIVYRQSDASTDWLEVPDWLRAQKIEAAER